MLILSHAPLFYTAFHLKDNCYACLLTNLKRMTKFIAMFCLWVIFDTPLNALWNLDRSHVEKITSNFTKKIGTIGCSSLYVVQFYFNIIQSSQWEPLSYFIQGFSCKLRFLRGKSCSKDRPFMVSFPFSLNFFSFLSNLPTGLQIMLHYNIQQPMSYVFVIWRNRLAQDWSECR